MPNIEQHFSDIGRPVMHFYAFLYTNLCIVIILQTLMR